MPCDPELRHELQQLYAELEREIVQAGPVCELSGRCCRFADYGHTLFVSSLEAELLLEDGLPEGAAIDGAGCPFQKGKLCTARDKRPLGCRVFYCDPTYQARGQELSEEYVARLKALAERLGRDWHYAPLDVMLRLHQTASSDSSARPLDTRDRPLR
jgi:Fe-S-cluster containining protein